MRFHFSHGTGVLITIEADLEGTFCCNKCKYTPANKMNIWSIREVENKCPHYGRTFLKKMICSMFMLKAIPGQ